MNLGWTLRILRGPMRPFLVRKLVDRVREVYAVRRARSRVPTMPSEGRSLRDNIVPLPSPAWFAVNGARVLAFARKMRSGLVGAYGIDRWSVGDPDPPEVDVRSVHELSRMHHWCAYALAAHIDGVNRDEWCDLLEREITEFMTSYPVGTGTHWKFPMGTGIRLHSMLVAWDWARRSGWSSVDGDRIVAATAIDHAELTFAERESRGGLSTSHYAANLLGVLAAGAYLEGHPSATTWLRVSASELRSEMLRQILADGMTNEASTGYHRQIVDTFMQAALLLHEVGGDRQLAAPERTVLIAALARCRQLESMGMPLIGDNDDGLAMKLSGLMADMSYTVDVAQRLFGAAALIRSTTDMESFGLYILSGQGIECSLRNGPVGQFGKGGHAHNDQNSLTVRVDGRWFVVDPGTSVYTRDVDERNRERSASMHSTMWPATSEQGASPPGAAGLFWMLDDHMQRSVQRTDDAAVRGEVFRPDVGRHVRDLAIDAEGLVGRDRFEAVDGVTAECVFILHPDVAVESMQGAGLRLTHDGVRVRLAWSGGVGTLDECHVCDRFASQRTARRLRIVGNDVSWSIRPDRP